MTLDEFYEKYNGKAVDTDGVPAQKYQCADLAKKGMSEMLGISFPSFTLSDINPHGYVRYAFEAFERYSALKANFTKISMPVVIQKGDLVVWGTEVGKAGHIAWGISGDAGHFYSFDQNWNNKYYCTKTYHSYNGVLGVLRPKAQEKITGKLVYSEPVTAQKVDYLPRYSGKSKSLVDALNELKVTSTYSYRKKIAVANGIKAYLGTASQNTNILKLLKRGQCIRP